MTLGRAKPSVLVDDIGGERSALLIILKGNTTLSTLSVIILISYL